MPSIAEQSPCCGMWILEGITSSTYNYFKGDPVRIFDQIVLDAKKFADTEDGNWDEAPFIVFNDVDTSTGGSNLLEYIRKNRLGKVTVHGPRVNPIHNSNLSVYVYEPNWKRVYKLHPKPQEEDNAELFS